MITKKPLQKHNYLLISVLILAILLFFLPFIVVDGHCLFTIVPSGMAPPIVGIICALNCAIVLICLVCLILYKNQRLQFILTNILLLMNALIYVTFYSLFYDGLFNGNKDINLGYGIGFYLPLIEIILLFLASYRIKKHQQSETTNHFK